MASNLRYSKQYGAAPDEGGEEGKHPLWMIIYTDMITNLMIFFLLCYCLTWLSQEDREIAAKSFEKSFGEKQTEAKIQEKKIMIQEKKAEDAIKEKFTNVEINEERIKIILPSPVLFDSGSAELKPGAKDALKQIADTVRGMSNRIVVEGHTDNKPLHSKTYESNWELATARAFGVIRYFMEDEGIDPRRLSALGYGENRPKDTNDTEEGRAVNRRIELNIIKAK